MYSLNEEKELSQIFCYNMCRTLPRNKGQIMLLKKLKLILRNQKGAMDKILVTLLFVIIGVGAVVGLMQWEETQKNALIDNANTQINQVTNG